MKRSDWECPVCKEIMVITPARYMTCFHGCTKLIPCQRIENLPIAKRTECGRIVIDFQPGYWESIGEHRTEMLEAPEEGVIVARVKEGEYYLVESFVRSAGGGPDNTESSQ